METAASVETWTTGAAPFAEPAAPAQRRLTTSPPMLGNASRSHSPHSPHDDEFHDFDENEKAADRRNDLAPERCPPGAQPTMTPRDFALRPVTMDSQNQPFSCGSRVKRRH